MFLYFGPHQFLAYSRRSYQDTARPELFLHRDIQFFSKSPYVTFPFMDLSSYNVYTIFWIPSLIG